MTSHAPTPGKPAQPAKNDIPSFDCCCWCCVVVARKESRLCRQKRNCCKFMSNALFNSCSCGPGFQPQAGSGLYGSRYGLRRGLLYGLPCGSRCGLLHSLLRDLLYGLLCSVRHAFPLRLHLTPAFNTRTFHWEQAHAHRSGRPSLRLVAKQKRTVELVGFARHAHALRDFFIEKVTEKRSWARQAGA